MLLGPLLRPGGRSSAAIRLTVNCPTNGEAKAAFSNNTDLLGSFAISYSAAPEAPVLLRIPLPYSGVFLVRRRDAAEALRLVWGGWLGESPGFRLMRPISPSRRDEVEWRVGLSNGYFVGAPCVSFSKLNKRQRQRLQRQKFQLIGDPSVYPEWLRDTLGIFGPRGVSNPTRCSTAWKEVHELIVDHVAHNDLPVTDQDDLNHRILLTFPVWLKDRLCREMLRTIVGGCSDKTLVRTVVSALRTGTPVDERTADRVWQHLVDSAELLSARMVPLRRRRISDEEIERIRGLHYVDPVNPVDLAARLTRVSRMGGGGGRLEEIPAEFRQNHPSFRGRLCPVESPESEMVGLTLQLAQGATVDFDGHILPA